MPNINMQVFEEARRNQLVTKVDIQTQVALDDYQVQLSNIANPTQSQDNVVIDRHGEFLPHWNKSFDFDTWVKMSMEIAGKRILMLHGNSNVNSASSIEDTMIFGDEFNGASIDTSKWSGDTGYATIINGTMKYYSGTITVREMTSIINFPPSAILESERKFTADGSNADATIFGFRTTDGVSPINHYTDRHNANTMRSCGSISSTNLPEYSYHVFKIETDSDTPITSWYCNDIQSSNSPFTSATTSTNINVFISARTAAYSQLKYVFVRKYTATIPVWFVDGGDKNMAVALKSLGRIG